MSFEIKLSAVGTIENREGRFYVSIIETYREALHELDGFSHINVIQWNIQIPTLFKY